MKPLTEKQRQLAEKNHGLIISFIQRNHLDLDEYYGDLAETYCVAISSYNENKGKLSTYIFVSLGNKMKNIYKSLTYEKIIPKELISSFDAPLSTCECSSTLAEMIPDGRRNVENEVHFKMAWEQIAKEFSGFELELLNNIIYNNQTQSELAKRYNTSQSSYARWEKAVKNKVRRILTDA